MILKASPNTFTLCLVTVLQTLSLYPGPRQMCPSKLVHALVATQLKGLMAPTVCRSDQLPDPATAE